ncbi:MAG: hypothetical protein IPK82_41160 [Polyangiaceae bacterium]|nr:hypothetical protein [Polyangiaceae bacterium]
MSLNGCGRAPKRGLYALGTSLLIAVSQFSGGPAHAQSKEELDKARAMFLEGVSLAAANNCAAALGKYQAVAKVKMTANVAYNMAECQERLGKLVSALGSYRLAASLVTDNKPAEVANNVGDRITSLEARIPRVVIQRTEQTSKIELDGVEIGTSQIGVENLVDPGTHTVSGKLGETEVWRETVQVQEKESKTVVVKIDLAKFKPPDRPTATATATVTATAPLPTVEPPSKVPAFVVGGIGIVSLGVGLGLMGASLGAASELEKICGADKNCPPSEQGKYDSGRTMAGVSTALLAVGAAGIATGVILFVVRSGGSAPQQPAVATQPAVSRGTPTELGVAVRGGNGSAGLSLIGRF